MASDYSRPSGFSRGMNRHSFGNAAVTYDARGRVVTGGSQYTDATYPQRAQYRSSSDYRSYDPTRDHKRDLVMTRAANEVAYAPAAPVGVVARPQVVYPSAAPAIVQPQRVIVPGTAVIPPKPYVPPYGVALYPAGHAVTKVPKKPGKTNVFGEPKYDPNSKYPISEHRRYSKRRPTGVFFLLAGVIMLAAALVNVLLCTEYHYYSRFWTAILMVELGVFGLLHKADYKSKWKNINYIATAILVGVACLLTTAFVLSTWIPQIKLISGFGNVTNYENAMALIPVDINVSGVSRTNQIWVCFAFDLLTLVVALCGSYALVAGAHTFHRYWRANFDAFLGLQVFTSPYLFNPYGPIPIGIVLVVFGLLTVFACEGSDYGSYYSPVWTGGIAILSGYLGASAALRPDRRCLNLFACVVYVLTIIACLATIVLCTMGMADDIKLLDTLESATDELERRLIASACIFALADMVALFTIFYAIGLMIRAIRALVSQDDYEQHPLDSSSYSESVDPRQRRDTFDPYNPYDQYRGPPQQMAPQNMMNGGYGNPAAYNNMGAGPHWTGIPRANLNTRY